MTKTKDPAGLMDTCEIREIEDQPKRLEILNGARRVFHAEGFDGASMGQIAHAAGVSKGTLYVYFESKEALFKALVIQDRKESAERLFQCGDEHADLPTMLQSVGESFVAMMVRPDHIALLRTVIGASEKFPESGRVFYENGPCRGAKRLAALLRPHVEAGELVIDDIEAAAGHFFALSQGGLVKPMLFGCDDVPGDKEIRAAVAEAVRIFLRAFAPERE